MATRINKYLSEIGYCSRRGADKLLEQGRITINGTVPELGEKVQEGDIVAVDGHPVGAREEKHVYIALNKPRGIVCTTDRRVEKTTSWISWDIPSAFSLSVVWISLQRD